MAVSINVATFNVNADAKQTSAGGQHGKQSTIGGNTRETVCALFAALLAAVVKASDGSERTKLECLTESQFAAWLKSVYPTNTPKQSGSTYLGHYQRLEHGYGPDAAYTTKNGKRVLKADSDKHLHSLKTKAGQPIKRLIKG